MVLCLPYVFINNKDSVKADLCKVRNAVYTIHHKYYFPVSFTPRAASLATGSADTNVIERDLSHDPIINAEGDRCLLIDNTGLTFEQIGDFCGLHDLEVQAIADGEVSAGMQGFDPVANGQLTKDEVSRCEADSQARLKMAETNLPQPTLRTKGPRYVPVARRW